MFKVIILCLFVGFLFCVPQSVRAQKKDSSEIIQIVENLNKLPAPERCTERWNVLWPWAKQGHLEARAFLFLSMGVLMHDDTTIPPGRTGDWVSLTRDRKIMFVHSLGVEVDDSELADLVYGYADVIFGEDMPDEFEQCFRDKKYGTCAAIAVERKRVPPFEQYAAEIDALVAQGFKPSCNESGYRKSMQIMHDSIKD